MLRLTTPAIETQMLSSTTKAKNEAGDKVDSNNNKNDSAGAAQLQSISSSPSIAKRKPGSAKHKVQRSSAKVDPNVANNSESLNVETAAADKGAEIAQMIAAGLGYVYAKRHKAYTALMARIQSFIIEIRKAGEANKMKTLIKLKYGDGGEAEENMNI